MTALIFWVLTTSAQELPGCISEWKWVRRPQRTGAHWSSSCGYQHTSLHSCQFDAAYDCENSVWNSNGTGGQLLVYYGGQLGNNQFQYAFATRLMDKLGATTLTTVAKETVPRWSKMRDKGAGCQATALVSDRDGVAAEPLCAQLRRVFTQKKPCVRVDGFFQDFRAIGGHEPGRRQQLADAFEPSTKECGDVDPPDDDEIVVHVRVCNYSPKRLRWPACYGDMPWEYYDRVLNAMTNRSKITILSPPSCLKSGNLVKRLQQEFGARRLSIKSLAGADDGRADYCYLKRAKRIVMQPSTFGWWAAWLSEAREIHFPLIGLFAHQRTLNYPRGPGRGGVSKKLLKCDALFQGRTKSLVVPESRYIYHDVIGGRYFGTYDHHTESFSFQEPKQRQQSVVNVVAPKKKINETEEFCRDPPERRFSASPRVIGLGPRSVELVCFAKWTEQNLVDPDLAEKERVCCNDNARKSGARIKILLFPRSHVEAALHYRGRERDLDFNFMGRVNSKQKQVTRARKWILEFANVYFTNRSHYLDTTAGHKNPRPYHILGKWDHSLSDKRTHGGEGFLPMDAMSRQKVQQCAMAKCDASYFETLARSLYTLAPAGDQPWSQRFFEAILAGSIPIVQSPEHTGRSAAEKQLGYKYLLASEFAARYRTFRRAHGPTAPLPYCADWAKYNLDIFLRHQTLIQRRQSLTPGLRLCEEESFA